MNTEKAAYFAGNFHNKRIAVIGDISIDSYAYGKLKQYNPDKEGKPLLTVKEEINLLGCGGNCAANAASLGGEVEFYGVIGNDGFAGIIEEICRKNNIAGKFFREGRTIIKRRFIAGEGEYIARADYGEENLQDMPEEAKKNIISDIEKNKHDAIILSDYNKRAFRGDFAGRIISSAKKLGIKVLVDPKPENIEKFAGADVVCPNLKEAREMLSEIHDPETLARKIKERLHSGSVIITLGKDGLMAYDGLEARKINSHAREVKDSIGAGDTLKAGIALSLASGADIFEAAEIGSICAGISVEKEGTVSVSNGELIKRINSID